MLARLIKFSLDNQVLIVAAVLFAVLGGVWSVRHTVVDAIPDLSDVQVIIQTELPGSDPQLIEDQITYPLTSKMLAVPHATAVRGYSYFGLSFVYVLFEDGTDLYWARSRVLEALSGLAAELPAGATPRLGPDATGVGWALQYVLNSERHSLDELRSLQDWYLRYPLSSIAGVAEVAPVGGFVRQYQIEVDPVRLRAYGIDLAEVTTAIRQSNRDSGGRVLELSERELMVRGKGLLRGLDDLRSIVLTTGPGGIPLLLSDVATITTGPELRRGLADWNGRGETVGGIVIVRSDADTRRTIAEVRDRLDDLQRGLPEGVTIDIAYDRTTLIERSIETLTDTLRDELLVVSLICLIFLLHFRSALVAVLSIPLSILLALIVLHYQGVGVNIMSLGGIAISIGVLVDAAIIMVENVHKHYELHQGTRSHGEIVLRAAQEVGPTLFFTLLIITVSFLPVFALENQEGRLFAPLAYTKTWTMAMAALLAITVVPVFMHWFVRGRIYGEERHPVSRLLRALYRPVLAAALRSRYLVILGVVALMAATTVPLQRIGSEFMPPLWEGDVLYMPTTLPGVSISQARQIVQQTDRILASFPEVESVFGKVGRAETATDPAPLSMLETTIRLRDPADWRPGMTRERLLAEFDRAVQLPGLTNAWTMPIKTRLDMLATGVRTPVGIKVGGPDLAVLEEIAGQIEAVVAPLPGTRSAYAERTLGATYLDFEIDRPAAARFGLRVDAIQEVIRTAIGGQNVSWTVEGLERYPINVRYPRELRDSPEALGQVLVATPAGGHVPLSQVGSFVVRSGPAGIKSENARPTAWVSVDLADVDLGSWVATAQREVQRSVPLPPGYTIEWSGQFESLQRARERLTLIIPVTLLLILVILYLQTRSWIKTAIVLTSIPCSLVGSIWLVDALGYNWSVAVIVGVIALAGLAAENGVVMLLYLDLAYERRQVASGSLGPADLLAAVDEGAVRRIRPKMMTVAATFCSLVPILWADGAGSDVLRRIAAPMVGGVFSSFLAILVLFPVLYFIWRSAQRSPEPTTGDSPELDL